MSNLQQLYKDKAALESPEAYTIGHMTKKQIAYALEEINDKIEQELATQETAEESYEAYMASTVSYDFLVETKNGEMTTVANFRSYEDFKSIDEILNGAYKYKVLELSECIVSLAQSKEAVVNNAPYMMTVQKSFPDDHIEKFEFDINDYLAKAEKLAKSIKEEFAKNFAANKKEEKEKSDFNEIPF